MMYVGENEAIVNFLMMYIMHTQFDKDFDTATKHSQQQDPKTPDQAAIDLMVTQNFRDGKPADISDTTKNEVRYQIRG